MEDPTTTEAYKRGVRDAEERLARRPPPSRWVSVSLDTKPDRKYFKLCTRCHWGAQFCECPPEEET